MKSPFTTRHDWALPSDYRPRQCAKIWQQTPEGWREQLVEALAARSGNHTPVVFFRADDVGAGGSAFEALCSLFRSHAIPLAMAVVPAWLSAARVDQLFRTTPCEEPLWGWHQHGWRHVNWQKTGKKSEFGEQRPYEKQWRDIWQGRQKMTAIFGDHYSRLFTPPWNRLSLSTMKILHELGFRGVSLDGPPPRGLRSSTGLKNFRVYVDLHTRKARSGPADYRRLLAELSTALGRKEPTGIMIHHQRMSLFAFSFLNELLQLLKHEVRAKFLNFRELPEQAQG